MYNIIFIFLIFLKVCKGYEDSTYDVDKIELIDKIMEKLKDQPMKEKFKAYHLIYRKTYDLNSEEGIKRYKTWKKNVIYIEEENKKGHSYTLGIGPYTDLTSEEFTKNFLCDQDKFTDEVQNIISNSENKIPFNSDFFDKHADDESVTQFAPLDWESWYMYPIKQRCCGACWAFSAAGTVEAFWNKRKMDKKSGSSSWLSPQQLVDCDTVNHGCEGGWVKDAFTYIKENGLFDHWVYQYNAVKGTCRYDEFVKLNKERVYIDGYELCSDVDDVKCSVETFYQMLKKGPVSVNVNASSLKWINYRSGILTLNDQDCGDRPNHSVIAIGWGQSNGKSFIRLRNSCGAGWGDKGYVKIEYLPESLSKTCHIFKLALQPKLR